jgi:hypothetical protein
MRTAQFSISGDNSLDNINQIIAFQELKYSEFMESKILSEGSSVMNLVTFKLYDDNTTPKKLILQKKDEAVPANAKKIWEGVMVVEKGQRDIIAYREN